MTDAPSHPGDPDAPSPYVDAGGRYRPVVLGPAAADSAVYAAARASWDAVNAHDREAWLGLWSPRGCIEDPVGPSFLDPEGRGHRGPEALAAFWERAAGTPRHIAFRFDRAVVCGREMLCTGTIRTYLGEQVMDAAGGVVYAVDEAGLLTSLRAFWETDAALATLRPAAEEAP